MRVAELALEADIASGVLNVVPGVGEIAGRAIGVRMDVDDVAFTGSAEVGKAFLRYAGESNMKKVQIEAGAKSAHIVLDDAPTIDRVAFQAAWGIFYNPGQVCSAGSRLVVHCGHHLGPLRSGSWSVLPPDCTLTSCSRRRVSVFGLRGGRFRDRSWAAASAQQED